MLQKIRICCNMAEGDLLAAENERLRRDIINIQHALDQKTQLYEQSIKIMESLSSQHLEMSGVQMRRILFLESDIRIREEQTVESAHEIDRLKQRCRDLEIRLVRGKDEEFLCHHVNTETSITNLLESASDRQQRQKTVLFPGKIATYVTEDSELLGMVWSSLELTDETTGSSHSSLVIALQEIEALENIVQQIEKLAAKSVQSKDMTAPMLTTPVLVSQSPHISDQTTASQPREHFAAAAINKLPVTKDASERGARRGLHAESGETRASAAVGGNPTAADAQDMAAWMLAPLAADGSKLNAADRGGGCVNPTVAPERPSVSLASSARREYHF